MQRYIDANEALRMMQNSKQDNPCKSEHKGIWNTAHECCMSCVDAVPTADVAPRAEVAKEIIDEFMSAMRVKHEENRPKYGGALALLLPDIEQIAAELKKKYTEEAK